MFAHYRADGKAENCQPEGAWGLLMLLLFGGLGVYYGFRVGSGMTRRGGIW